ncbi:DUF551 domain-containing protein [Mediterraneibacter gnavus]|jgi:hypothetical protein|uniref:DUF551 domain-containing protein n=1 Tax=Mediterraneibacter gnavus TaxID=33038 RepID=UPI0006C567C2|nr:DUF551 domain-containing protein [Mediterraneibacter gnavus]CUO41189.1 Uncharacterised protein [Mediterraneibacter gnavus]
MNVLEKILEEIENESQLAHEEMRRCVRGNPLQFDEVKGYARAMEYVVDTIRSHMDDIPNCGDCSRRKWYQKGYEDGKKDNDWIPVSDKLPEAGDGKYYPLLNVQTSYGAVKCGFYRVRDDRWYIYEEFYNEFIEANKKEVVAWQPFPEPYKEE